MKVLPALPFTFSMMIEIIVDLAALRRSKA